MLTIKSMKHIRQSRNVKSFRSAPNATGVALAHHDTQRLCREEERLMVHEAQRLWLNKQWHGHFGRVAGPLRVLPPAARGLRTEGR